MSVPIITGLLDRPTMSLAVDSREVLGTKDHGRFMSAHGKAYEEYVGKRLSHALLNAEIYSEDEAFNKKQEKCDFIVVEESSVTLVEVKAGRVSLQAMMTANKELLEAEISKDGGIADAVIQLDRAREMIKSGQTRIRRMNVTQGLIVLSTDMVLLNSPWMKEIIVESVFKKTGKKPAIKFQICNDFGFDRLCAYLKTGRRLGKFVYDKVNDKEMQIWDIHLAVPEGIGPYRIEGEQDALDRLLEKYGIDPGP